MKKKKRKEGEENLYLKKNTLLTLETIRQEQEQEREEADNTQEQEYLH